MKKRPVGYCALCGAYGQLTYEHIPPKAAFNSVPVKMYKGPELIKKEPGKMPWDVHELTYTPQQKGAGKYSLCESCNNNTGSWYGAAYQDMAQRIALALHNPEIEDSHSIGIKDVYPLRFLKQVIAMFCSVNDYESLCAYVNPAQVADRELLPPMLRNLVESQEKLYEAALMMDELRKFVLDREVTGLEKSRFKICMYMTKSQLWKFNGLSSVIDIEKNTCLIVSEITAAPFGFVLYFNPQENMKSEGVDITSLADFGYAEKCDLAIPTCLLEMNTYLPHDYRTKNMIETDMKQSANELDAEQPE